MLAVGGAVSSCTALAGLDGDYVVGNPALTGGGQGSGASGSTGPGAGGATSGGGSGASGPGGASSSTTVGSGGNAGSGGSPPTSDRQLSCNQTACAVGEVCCATPNPGSVNNTQNGCAVAGGCSLGQFEIECNGPEDCGGGQICCGRWPNGYYEAVECTTANDCLIGNNDYIFCIGSSGPDSGLCVNGGSCGQSSDLPGYYFCG